MAATVAKLLVLDVDFARYLGSGGRSHVLLGLMLMAVAAKSLEIHVMPRPTVFMFD